ncbi:MAG: low molecular weight protein arginine phosphatase [Anaerolineales bacterium]|jgi:ribose 5-phosphate isomerase B
MNSVLFVCTANICRSPMAEGLMKIITRDREEPWLIQSAGVWAYSDQPAAINTIKILKEYGIDLSGHRSRSISQDLMDNSNLIMVMEKTHKETLETGFPERSPKIFLVSEMEGNMKDIHDPIGGTIEDFRSMAEQINRILEDHFEKIYQLSMS